MPTIAVSSWSVRYAFGPMYPGLATTNAARLRDDTFGAGSLTLLDFPAAARAAGIGAVDLCHFHFPRTDDAFLRAFRERLAAAGVQVLTLLVDEGDISAPDAAARERDLAHIRDWIDIGARIGAQHVRVAAGLQPPDAGAETLQRSAAGLMALAHYARRHGISVLTENWRPLAMLPENVLAILDATAGTVGLCVDLGNYKGPDKYDALTAILPRATTIHAHAFAGWVTPGATDRGDLVGCLDLARAAGFAGTYVLIFAGDGTTDEWSGITEMARIVQEHC